MKNVFLMNFQNSHKLFLIHSFLFTLFTPEDLKRMISNLHPIQFSDRRYQIGYWRSPLTCLSLPQARSCARCQGYRRKCESISAFRELPLKMKEVDIEEVKTKKKQVKLIFITFYLTQPIQNIVTSMCNQHKNYS